MEKVHFQQEQMLPALKALHKHGIFSTAEVKQIYKTRSDYERRLVARIAKKDDYLRYIEYESRLEKLRSVRWERIKPEMDKMAEHSITRRVFYLFERAVKKFKADVGLWVEYIKCAMDFKSRALAGRICARAIQLHPTTPALYILSSTLSSSEAGAYESPDKSRTLLQRGLRMNKESVELWVEYIKFELGFVETLRRRWEVLGIAPGKTTGDEEEMGVEEVLCGAIVKTVIEEGSKALGGNVGFFKRVLEVVEDYPLTDPGMRSEARRWVYEMVKEWCWETGEGRWLYTQRDLPSVGNDVWDMDVLRARHEEMLGSMREEWRGRERYESLYGTWLGTMAGTVSVDALRRYLLLSFLHAGVGGRDLRSGVKSMM